MRLILATAHGPEDAPSYAAGRRHAVEARFATEATRRSRAEALLVDVELRGFAELLASAFFGPEPESVRGEVREVEVDAKEIPPRVNLL